MLPQVLNFQILNFSFRAWNICWGITFPQNQNFTHFHQFCINLVLISEKSEGHIGQFKLIEVTAMKFSGISALCSSVTFSYSDKRGWHVSSKSAWQCPTFYFGGVKVVLYLYLFLMLENPGCQKLSSTLSWVIIKSTLNSVLRL